MRKSIKFLCIVVGVLTAAIVFLVMLLLYFGRGMIGCEYIDRNLGQSRLGDKITAQEEICDGFGASVFMTIRLAEAHGGNNGVIFSYEPYLGSEHPIDPPPRVTWIADDIAVIAVDRVDTIHVQHPGLGRDRIRYQIGSIGGRELLYWKLLNLL